ncbi:MAG: ribbon-helix-helix domain-containing protein [Candidatus Woesearchaeota archaeon]
MTMSVAQVRLPDGLLEQIDSLVEKKLYANKSDVIRDAVRKLLLEKQIGSIPDTGNSVQEIRKIRKKLSKQKTSLKEINSF